MRTAKFAVILLVILVAGCIFSLQLLERFVDEATQPLEQAHAFAQAGDLQSAARLAEQAHRQWQTHETLIGSMLRHDEADDLRYLFMRLSSYAKTNEGDEFCAECAELIARLEHIYEMEQPKLQNLL